MKSFLEYVAKDIISKHGTDLSRIAVVFPNKRASLFLNDYLAKLAGKPIWSPAYLTISDLFRAHSDLTVADPIKLVCDLHRCFLQVTGIDETLDHFYGWGQLLLADFDDVDKNMADADKVFANLRDIHELDDVSYLTEEQKATIKQFFSNFSEDHNTELKQRFLALWSHMGNLYHAFNQMLAAQQMAYEGALYRQVALDESISFEYDTYIFVGFNMLQRVEQRLFDRLKRAGRARFYWDFDQYYMKNSEAGHFIAQYLEHFPNELDTKDDAIYNRFKAPKQLNYISAPTENIQARYIGQWLMQDERIADGRQTAIVLANEALLSSAIHCLPDAVDKVNITTGFPLSLTPIATFITQFFTLVTTGYAPSRDAYRLRFVNQILRHPYAPFISEKCNELLHELQQNKTFYPSVVQLTKDDEGLGLLFRQQSALLPWLLQLLQRIAVNANSEEPMFQESVFRAYTLINRLSALVESGDLQVDIITMQRLVGQLIQSTNIPFHGEPAEGIQMMGVLETRNLDFRHVLLLSCNEGNLPRGISDTSFIPYSIRKAYGLTTIDHKVAIYSYYFHRLLQRAEDITIVYNNATSDGQTGEMSRFMLQLMVESPHTIRFGNLRSGYTYKPFNPQEVVKTPDVMQRLLKRFALTAHHQPSDPPLLTPTAINRYMRCPMIFYYNYVCGIREPQDIEDDVIDNRVFGNIFHEASQYIYERLMSKSQEILKEDIDELLRTRIDIERAVDEAIAKEFKVKSLTLNGLQIINREVIIHYLRQLLTIDRRLAPFTIVGLEKDVKQVIEIAGSTPLKTTIGGRIDRLDCINDEHGQRIRVIDYKTGGKKLKALADVNAIFDESQLSNHSDYYLQTFVYADIVSQTATESVSPALLFIQHAAGENYDPTLCFGANQIVDIKTYRNDFNRLLMEKLQEIFNADIAFVPTADRGRCTNCAFKQLCGLVKE